MEAAGAVGRSVPRLDAVAKVTGRAKYAGDLTLPGMAHVRVWRSPVPHGRLHRIETGAALAVPGVLAVLTAADLADLDPYYGPAFKDQPILAADRVRYAGEPVAAVIAETEAAAAWAVARLEVELEELPAVATIDAALADGAPVLHERLRPAGHFRDLAALTPVPEKNLCQHSHYERGDVEAAFAAADVVVEGTYTLPAVYHYAMEPHTVLAQWEAEGITVWAATQHPFPVRKELAEIFGLPLARVRVVVPYLGGAYGSKCYTKLEPLAVAASRKVGRPVRLALAVEEACRTVVRHGARCWIRTAARRDGTLLAREAKIYFDTGAYADVGPRVVKKAGYRLPGPYRIPHLRVDAYAVYTNTVPAGAYRGYGTPQVTWAGESQLDELAERLGMDPVELRLKNLLRRGEPYAAGDRPIDGDLPGDLRALARAIGWEEAAPPGRARGVAVGFKDGGGTHTVSTALVRIHADGSVTLLAGSVEHGQGARTVLAQIAAEILELPVERIAVAPPDTAVTPFDQGTSASRSTTLMGLAVAAAARDAREQLVRAAAEVLGAPPGAVRYAGGILSAGGASLGIAEVVRRYFGLPGGELVGRGAYRPEVFEGTLGGATTYWEIGMGAAEVSVDADTGLVRVHRYVSLADVGRAVNPRECEGQDEGGAMQALGHTLFEQLVQEEGQILNPTLADYRVPLFTDLPEAFSTVLVENGDGPGPFGLKGLGEGGTFAVAPAVANALARATGVRVRELPLTPERVWRALRA
ncbi:MAG TPA: xanthine dehydrogenase family protein molybdopterin-binding subunit, partial [Thermodesulfobacteriota bacterium]|nr:xanthine dehydrogenase family protein molybdopterin-binding subunit [Thermodesulfobacteriota bacterium]